LPLVSPTAAAAVLKAAEDYVKKEMAANDGSHDWHHIDRVRRSALALAHEQRRIQASRSADPKPAAAAAASTATGAGGAPGASSSSSSCSSGVTDNKAGAGTVAGGGSECIEAEIDADTLLVVELAALLHDIKDWKYSGSESAGGEAAAAFLKSHAIPQPIIDRVVHVVNSIGFKSELGSRGSGSGSVRMTIELGVVQDADRLDAIGAIGIARCFTFGGTKHRALYDPDNPPTINITKDQYVAQSKAPHGRGSPSINHFYEKLLLLKDLMKTDAGQRRAAARHAYTEQFLAQFKAEWDGAL